MRNPLDGRVSASEQRTEQSKRAEEAYVDWSTKPPSERPLRKGRGIHAAALFDLLRARGVSAERFADWIGVPKSVAQKYLSGEKPIPTTLLDADDVPLGVRLEFLERVIGTARVEREIDRLDRKGLVSLRNRIIARIDALDDERSDSR